MSSRVRPLTGSSSRSPSTSDFEAFAQKFGATQMVLIVYTPGDNATRVVSWGSTLADCEQAEEVANELESQLDLSSGITK